jgi:hypothetical protein
LRRHGRGQWDGTNEQDVFREMQRRGFLHSAIPAPQNFILGMCAPAELETVREALSERVIKGHLVDIVDDAAAGEGQRSEKALGGGGGGGGCALQIRGLDGRTTLTPIPHGSFVINCTDHIGMDTNSFHPVVSGKNIVASPLPIFVCWAAVLC